MWCTIYQLYADGQRLPAAEAQERGMYGWLYMYSRLPGTGMPKSCAHLLPAEDAPILQELIQPLMHCTLSLVKGGGMMLRGQEWRADYQHMRQQWWCIPGAKDAPR